MLVREDGSIAGTIGGGCVEAEVWAAAKEVMNEEAPRKMTFSLNNEANYDNGLICGGTLEIFVEPILPQPMLYIFGGGHVSIALANSARSAGFNIGVIDDRESFANHERFPMAQEIHASFEEAFEKLKPTAATYMVIVTRGHKDDMRVLAWAINTSPRYIGMIGSKRKVISVYRALEKDGVAPEKFAGVHAPVGLDIGALDSRRNRHKHHGGADLDLAAASRSLSHKALKNRGRNNNIGRINDSVGRDILARRHLILSAGASTPHGAPESAAFPTRKAHFSNT